MTGKLCTQQRGITRWHQAIEGLYQIAAVLNPAISESEIAEKALARVLDLAGVTGGCIKLFGAGNRSSVAAVRGLEYEDLVRDCASCPCHERLLAGALKAVELIDCPCLPPGDLTSLPRDEHFHVLETAGSQIAMAL